MRVYFFRKDTRNDLIDEMKQKINKTSNNKTVP
jgi:hypothetical protein